MRRFLLLAAIVAGVVAVALLGAGGSPRSGVADTPTPTPAPLSTPVSVTGGLVRVEPPPPGPCPAEGLPPEQVAATIDFTPGWNLVAGPVGSCMRGASEALVPVEGSSDGADGRFIDFPVTTSLGVATGVWAYFPAGGSVQLMAEYVPGPPPGEVAPPGNQGVCGVSGAGAGAEVVPAAQFGGWRMVGNPFAHGAAKLGAGVSEALAYSPDRGYFATTEIPLGQAAWVLGPLDRGVELVPPPAPAPSEPASLTSCRGLMQVAPQQDDLPGFRLLIDGSAETHDPSVVASYSEVWLSGAVDRTTGEKAPSDAANGPIVLAQLVSYASPAAAHAALPDALASLSGPGEAPQIMDNGSQGLGDEDFSSTASSPVDPTVVPAYVEAFRRGAVVVLVVAAGPPGTMSLEQVVALARIIDARLAAAGG